MRALKAILFVAFSSSTVTSAQSSAGGSALPAEPVQGS